MKIKDMKGKEHEVPLTNKDAVASVRRAGWTYCPETDSLRYGGSYISVCEVEQAKFDILNATAYREIMRL